MEAMTSHPVRQPVWALTYETKNITAAIAPHVLQVTYTDNLSGASDELEINLEDSSHRWKNAWAPAKGDRISLQFGYAGEPLLQCGDFQIDEIEYNGPPDTVSIRCLAAGVTPALRTRNSKAYEGRTLKGIAQEVANRHNLELVGQVPEVKVDRITQNAEQDLALLKRLGESYGYVFSVRGAKLAWHELAALDSKRAIVTIERIGLAGSYTLRTKTSQVYKAAQVSYHDPKTKTLKSHTEKATGVTTGDTLKLVQRCENKAQAEAKAKAALRNSNGRQIEGSVTLHGDPRVVAGINVELAGFGVLSGKYQVLKSRHAMDRMGGYTTTLELSTTSAHASGLKNLRNDKGLVK